MAWLFQQKTFGPSKLTAESVQQFINTHTEYLNQALDTAIREKSLDDISIQRLKESNYVFSGIKTFHELNEAFPKLVDENGNKIPFNLFLNNVQSINESYNRTYLKTEYEFAQSSAMMAARWKEFEKDGDNYYLQYRTVGDKRVRKTHRMLHNITLPFSSKFWDKYFPPNGWNCRCTVVQVRKDKYKISDETAAMNAGSQATAGKHQEMFMFNPGKEMTTFPAYNAYTIKSCKTCPYRLGKMDLSRINIPNNELCAACEIIRSLRVKQQEKYKENKNLYEKYKDDPNYINVEFNEKTGGMKATHKEHNFDNKKGWYETSVMEVGFQNGHSIIFEKEDHTVQNKKNVEGLWDNQNFEIGAAENFTKQNIRNALKHCAKKPDCDIAVIFVPDENNYDKNNLFQGILCYEGLRNTKQWKLFNLILFISKDRILYKYKQKKCHPLKQ